MKGEYVEPNQQHQSNMFTKLHQTQSFQHHGSDESDRRSPGGATAKSDGASIEVVRRPRGRPPGSKNKPKPPLIITKDSEPAMSPYILEVAGGVDIIDSITRFCKKRNTGISILSASGSVANVTLRQPVSTPGATVTFHGRFDVLSLSATVFPAPGMVSPPVGSGFTISLAGPQGQIVGGAVVGPLVAAATVYVVAASFNNPSFHRLPEEDEMRSSGSGGGNEVQSPTAVSGSVDGGHPRATAETCGMSMYSCHLPSDVIWAPTARQPPPHYQ